MLSDIASSARRFQCLIVLPSALAKERQWLLLTGDGQLRELAAFKSVKEALETTTVQHVPTRIPLLVEEDGVMRVYLPEDAVNRWDVPEHMTKM